MLATLRPRAMATPSLTVLDDVLDPSARARVRDFLDRGGWKHGWKSDAKTEAYPFWHKHFAGNIHPDHRGADGRQYDCDDELRRAAPLLHDVWRHLSDTALRGHRLLRCYANGQPFGTEGTLHTDSVTAGSFTAIYYPHDTWDPNWGGETVFFTADRTDIVASIYPRPNRLLVFPGTIPHVARGVSRICPVLRVTLMFKTEEDGGGAPHPAGD
jgi:SM-20-related protein